MGTIWSGLRTTISCQALNKRQLYQFNCKFFGKKKKLSSVAKLSVLSLSFGFRGCEGVETFGLLNLAITACKTSRNRRFCGENMVMGNFCYRNEVSSYFNLMKPVKVGDSLSDSLTTLSMQLTFEQR